MAIIRWKPMTIPSMMTNIPSMWDEDDMDMTMNHGIDVYETENEVIVNAPVPGIPADKVDVTFEDGVLRISARYEESEEEKKRKKVIYRQQRVSAFDYTTTLPRAVDANTISAEVHDGIVTVKAPIAQAAKPKKISVKAQGK